VLWPRFLLSEKKMTDEIDKGRTAPPLGQNRMAAEFGWNYAWQSARADSFLALVNPSLRERLTGQLHH
jgi:hypothetical protein